MKLSDKECHSLCIFNLARPFHVTLLKCTPTYKNKVSLQN